MPSAAKLDRIRSLEYWTPGQCAALYPHCEATFRRLLDNGLVRGYSIGGSCGRVRRYLNAASVRAHFQNLEAAVADVRARYDEELERPRSAPMAELLARDPRIQAMRAARTPV